MPAQLRQIINKKIQKAHFRGAGSKSRVGLVHMAPKGGGQTTLSHPSIPTHLNAPHPGGSDGKESACSAGDLGLIPGREDSPGGGNGNPLQDSCSGKFHGQRSLAGYSPWVAKSQTRLSTAQHNESDSSVRTPQRCSFSLWTI